jgi:organic radical activating enzyme
MKPVRLQTELGEIEVPQAVHSAMVTCRNYAQNLAKKVRDGGGVAVIIESNGDINITTGTIGIVADNADSIDIPANLLEALDAADANLQKVADGLDKAKADLAALPESAPKAKRAKAEKAVAMLVDDLSEAIKHQSAAEAAIEEHRSTSTR